MWEWERKVFHWYGMTPHVELCCVTLVMRWIYKIVPEWTHESVKKRWTLLINRSDRLHFVLSQPLAQQARPKEQKCFTLRPGWKSIWLHLPRLAIVQQKSIVVFNEIAHSRFILGLYKSEDGWRDLLAKMLAKSCCVSASFSFHVEAIWEVTSMMDLYNSPNGFSASISQQYTAQHTSS